MKKNRNKTKGRTAEISLGELLLTIREWYRYLLHKWPVILLWSFLGGLTGGVYACLSRPVYIASTTFVLEDDSKVGGLGQYASLASMVGIDLNGGRAGSIFQGDNILELYKSRTMIENTLLTEINYHGKKELLIDRYISFNRLKEKWYKTTGINDFHFRRRPLGAEPELTRLQDSIMGIIVDDINKKCLNVVKPDKKLNIIKAEVKAADELFARAFDEQIVKNVNEFYLQTKTKRSMASVLLLQRKTDSVKAIMNGAIYTAASAADATPNLNSSRMATRVVPVQRSMFTVETNKTMLGELIKNLELAKLNVQKDMPLIEIIDQPRFPLIKKELKIWQGFLAGSLLMGFLTSLYLWLRKLSSELISKVDQTV